MNEIQLTKKHFSEIASIASKELSNKSSYTRSYEDFKLETVVEATIAFINKNNILIGNGKLLQINKESFEKEFKDLYNKLSDESKLEYVMKRDRAQVLYTLEVTEEKLKQAQTEIAKIKKELEHGA